KPARGPYSDVVRRDTVPVLDAGLIGLLRRKRVDVVEGVRAFEASSVLLTDDTRLTPDAVIAATGYRCALQPLLRHLGALSPAGKPAVHGANTHPNAPGLHFIGFATPISGQLREIGIDAPKVAKAISEAVR